MLAKLAQEFPAEIVAPVTSGSEFTVTDTIALSLSHGFGPEKAYV